MPLWHSTLFRFTAAKHKASTPKSLVLAHHDSWFARKTLENRSRSAKNRTMPLWHSTLFRLVLDQRKSVLCWAGPSSQSQIWSKILLLTIFVYDFSCRGSCCAQNRSGGISFSRRCLNTLLLFGESGGPVYFFTGPLCS